MCQSQLDRASGSNCGQSERGATYRAPLVATISHLIQSHRMPSRLTQAGGVVWGTPGFQGHALPISSVHLHSHTLVWSLAGL